MNTLIELRARSGEKEVPVCPFLSTFPCPSLPRPYLSLPLCPPCPPLPLELGPLNSARGMGSPGIFWHLGNESGCDNFNYFPESRVIKFCALQSEQ